MRWLPGPQTRAAILQHPVILAGLAVVALLALTAGVLVILDSVRGDGAASPEVRVDPMTTSTAGPTAKTAIAGGVIGKTNTTTAVRVAPGRRTSVLGTLARNADVQIDGRSSDSGWLRILFPPRSELHGWVDAESIDVEGDVEVLAIATAEPPSLVNLPTALPNLATPTPEPEPPDTCPTPEDATPVLDAGVETPTVEPCTIEATATPDGLPDLVIGTPVTISDGKLFVTVVNQGSGDMTGDLVVAVFNEDESALLGGATVPGFALGAGLSIDVDTGYPIVKDQVVTLIVDPNGDIEETDNTNNRITILIAIGPGGTD